MKQQASILQWASIMLDEEVTHLNSIQDVKFVKNLLWKTDQSYFKDWKGGKGVQSYGQVLQTIAKYFKQQIGTDISHQIEALNVYKNVIEVWQLVLGIAIKGNNRGANINLIFMMDHAIQAELVGIVSAIIDKFGQNAANSQQEEQHESDKTDMMEEGKERQMIIQLLEENEELKQKCHQLEIELSKENKVYAAQRQQLQHSLEMLKLQKLAFLQTIANANRSDSKIFDDAQNSIAGQASLPELGNDIVIFIREQRKRLSIQIDKNLGLEDDLKDMRREGRRIAQQNQVYMTQLNNLTVYERDLQNLRIQKNQIFQQNSLLLENIASLELQKYNLINQLQKKQNQYPSSSEEVSQTNAETSKKNRQTQNKINKNNQAKRDVNSSAVSGDSDSIKYIDNDNSRTQSDKAAAVNLKKEVDQLRQPQLRNKLQRQIVYLKATINGLQRQNQALKKANEVLQRSTKQFMESNQKVIHKWQQDYESLLMKIGKLTQITQEKQQKQQIKSKNQSPVKQIKMVDSDIEEEKQQNSIDERSNSEMSSRQVQGGNNDSIIEEKNKQIENAVQKQNIQIKIKTEVANELMKDRVALWEEIVYKLRDMVKQGKTKELAYQNSLNQLRSENFKLVQMLRNKNRQSAELSASKVSSYEPNRNSITDEKELGNKLNIQRIDSIQVKENANQRHLAPPRMMSYISIQQGDDYDQVGHSRFRNRDKSSFFQMNSVILDEIQEKKPQPSQANEEYYMNLNRKLNYSIRQSIEGLGGQVHEKQLLNSVELQDKLQKQVWKIQKQYQKLNNNYQQVFNKLHIYSDKLKQKQTVKNQYVHILAEITKAEEDIKASHEAQIIKLRLINGNLHQHLTQTAVQKQQILAIVKQLSQTVKNDKKQQQKHSQNILNTIQKTLQQAQLRYNQSFRESLSFVDICIQSSSQTGQLQIISKMLMRQRQKTKQLGLQLQLMSSVLLQYRTMLS